MLQKLNYNCIYARVIAMIATAWISGCSSQSGYLATTQIADALTTNGIELNQAAQLTFSQQPVDTQASDNIPVVVEVLTLSGAPASVSVPITVSYTDTQGVQHNTVSQSTNGVASFNLSIFDASTHYTFTASSPGLASATSNSFAIFSGSATTLKFVSQPRSSVVAGSPLNASLQVAVTDGNGNLVATSTAPVTITVSSGTTLGSAQAVAVNGVATFSSLALTTAGTGYVLTATSGGLTSASSSSFNVTPAAATQLGWSTQPGNVSIGTADPAVVQIQDPYGNLVSTASAAITVTCNDCATPTVVSGAATTAGALSVSVTPTTAQNGYRLTATASGLMSAVSNTFNVGTGYATPMLVQSQSVTNVGNGTALITLPVTATAAGHLLIVNVVATNPEANVVSITDNVGNTYVSAGALSDTTDVKQEEIWYAKNSNAGATTLTVTLSQINGSNHAWLQEWSGMDTTAPLDVARASSNVAGSTTLTAPTVTTTIPGEVVVSGAAAGLLSGLSNGSVFTIVPLAGQPSLYAYTIANTPGTYGPVWTINAADTGALSTVSFKPARL